MVEWGINDDWAIRILTENHIIATEYNGFNVKIVSASLKEVKLLLDNGKQVVLSLNPSLSFNEAARCYLDNALEEYAVLKIRTKKGCLTVKHKSRLYDGKYGKNSGHN
jgi:archaellum biogenesis ATPase FlaH